MHGHRICWFWTKIRCTGVDYADFGTSKIMIISLVAFWCHFVVYWGPFWTLLGPSGDPFRPSLGILRVSWGSLGTLWGCFGAQSSLEDRLCSWKWAFWDQHPMHRRRICWFWTKIRCTDIEHADFCMSKIMIIISGRNFLRNTNTFEQLNRVCLLAVLRAQRSELFNKKKCFWTTIRCTGVEYADFCM